MQIVCYLRQGSNVFETYWTTRRGVEAMDNTFRLLDLAVYGWEDSPAGWPQRIKASKPSVRTDVPLPSGLARRPDIRTTWSSGRHGPGYGGGCETGTLSEAE